MMTNPRVIEALRRPSRERSDEEIKFIFHHLRQMDVFRIVADGPLLQICQAARFERQPKDHILFRRGQAATCWYILLSGSVLMNNQVYLPSGCFGKRNGLNLRRSSDCLVLQQSDLIVIDYPDVQRVPVHYSAHSYGGSLSSSGRTSNSTDSSTLTRYPKAPAPAPPSHYYLGPNLSVQPPPPLPSTAPTQRGFYPTSFRADHSPTPTATGTLRRVYPEPAADYSDSTLTGRSRRLADWSSNPPNGGQLISSASFRLEPSSAASPAQRRVPSPAPRAASISIVGARVTSPPGPSSACARAIDNRMDASGGGLAAAYRRPTVPGAEMELWDSAAHTATVASTAAHFESRLYSATTSVQPKSPAANKLTSSATSVQLPATNTQFSAALNNKRSSLHDTSAHHQMAQMSLVDSFDSGVQSSSKSLSSASQPNFDTSLGSSSTISSTAAAANSNAAAHQRYGYSSSVAVNGNPEDTATANPPTNNDFFLAPSAQRINKMRMQLSRKNSDDSCSSATAAAAAAASAAVKIRTQSAHSIPNAAALRRLRGRSTASSSTTDGDEFAGLPEAAVDSDDDEDAESIPSHDFSFVELKDNVRECLEKEPSQRTADDIHVLMEFMQQMPALASLPLSIKRQLCLKMVFAIVPDAGTTILHHGERIDSWSVIVNGAVEHSRHGERVAEYRLGDAFGAEPIPRPQFMDGEMRTLVDECEFVLVEHEAYCSIMSTLNQHIEKENDTMTGEVVREAERRVIGSQVALVIIKAKADRLVQHLVEETDAAADDNFVQDFLLVYRVFIFEPTEIMRRIVGWFAEGRHREKVTRIVLLWVNNHFNDFEANTEMLALLDQFESHLEKAAMYNQQSLLNITCSIKSRPRQLTVTRSNRAEELAFSVIGGNAQQTQLPAFEGLFVAAVDEGSAAQRNGLKRGDELLEVNGQSCRTVPLSRVLDVLRDSTHLSLNVKSNMMGFKDMLAKQEHGLGGFALDPAKYSNTGTMGRYQKKAANVVYNGPHKAVDAPPYPMGAKPNGQPATPGNHHHNNNNSLSHAAKATMFGKLKTMLKGAGSGGNGHTQEIDLSTDAADDGLHRSPGGPLRASRSNPDIAGHLVHPNGRDATRPPLGMPPRGAAGPNGTPYPENAIKVYKSDQSFRFLVMWPETTAKQIVQMALQEFGLPEPSDPAEWSLCECVCTVVDAEQKADRKVLIKQRRLPDNALNLHERVGLTSRLYLKNNLRAETLLPDELAPDVLKEGKINLYALNAQTVAVQLTLHDFDVFSSIEPTEYVDNLFQLESRYGWPRLTQYEDLFNKEMWWVVTEVCVERSVAKRAKIIKKFIKVARHCRDLRNFNSMFAIVSGLEKPAVRRLSHTWERIPGKYQKMLSDIQQLMDPSRNMSKYRQHLASASQNPPVMPIYPVLKKDLTFAHESKPTYCGALINFEKLRMIARIIRSVTLLCSVKYDLDFMMGQTQSGDTGTVRKFAAGSSGTVKSLGNMSRKKLYEHTQMQRKVRAYLAELPIIDVEPELDQLSLACEPNPAAPNNGSASGSIGYNSAPMARRRPPSPSPSSLSSHSNQSADQKGRLFQQQQQQNLQQTPKFGVESPQAIQKMLSLVQNSKSRPPAVGGGLRPPVAFGPATKNSTNVRRIPSFTAASVIHTTGSDIPPPTNHS